MNLRHLEVFFAVMTAQSVTGASQKLRITQPSVTTTIKQAEHKLGIKLFERYKGRLVPTEEAKILFEEASRAHESLEIIRSLAEKMRSGYAGHVHIAATNTLSMAVMPNTVVNFQTKFKRFSCSISTMNTEQILSNLEDRTGSYNLGFTHGVNEHQSVNSIDIGATEILCLFPKVWDIPHNNALDLSLLKDKPYVSNFASTPIGVECNKLFSDIKFKPNVVANVHSHYLACSLTLEGMGYTLVDSITISTLLNTRAADDFHICRLKQQPKIPVMAVFSGNRALSDQARYFIDCFKASFNKINNTTSDECNKS